MPCVNWQKDMHSGDDEDEAQYETWSSYWWLRCFHKEDTDNTDDCEVGLINYSSLRALLPALPSAQLAAGPGSNSIIDAAVREAVQLAGIQADESVQREIPEGTAHAPAPAAPSASTPVTNLMELVGAAADEAWEVTARGVAQDQAKRDLWLAPQQVSNSSKDLQVPFGTCGR